MLKENLLIVIKYKFVFIYLFIFIFVNKIFLYKKLIYFIIIFKIFFMENLNNFFVCESCFKIPIFGLNYKKNNKIFIECLCENCHFYKKNLMNFFNKKNFNFNNNFLFDNNKNIGFCITCNKKINENYSKNHKKHKIEFFDNIFLSNDEIILLKNKIKSAEKNFELIIKNFHLILNKINQLLNIFKNSFNKYKILNNYELTFSKELINQYEIIKPEFNYQIIKNIKNIIKFNDLEKSFLLNLKTDLNFNNLIKYFNELTKKENFILKSSKLNLKFPKIKNEKKNINLIKISHFQIIFNHKIFVYSSSKIHKFIYKKQTNTKKLIIGKIINGKKEGFCIESVKNLYTLIGKFHKDKLISVGKFNSLKTFPDFISYFGEFKDNYKNGYGIIIFPHNRIFQGEFKFDNLNGFGYEFFSKKNNQKSTNFLYEGFWRNGMKDGYGILHTEKINYLQKYSNGRLIYSIMEKFWNKNKYYGEFSDEKMDGFGVLNYSNGDKFEGSFKNDLKDGFGIYSWADGDCYEGNFKEDKRVGFGKYFIKNKIVYEGNWNNNNFNGFGKYFYKNGNVFEGFWKNGLKNGKGKMFYSKKNEWIEEVYKDDKLINE